MNRTIALLIPAILLVAMALIVFQQFYSSSNENLVTQPVSSSDQEDTKPLPGVTTPEADSEVTSPDSEQASSTTREPMISPPQSSQPNDAGAVENATTSATAEATDTNSATESEATPKVTATKPETKPEQVQKDIRTTPTVVPKHKMESLKFKYQDSDMLFVLTADSEFEYKTFQLKSPERLVIDVIGEWTGIEFPSVPSNRLIKGIRGGKTKKGQRIVLDMKEVPKGYETKRDGNTVTVHIY